MNGETTCRCGKKFGTSRGLGLHRRKCVTTITRSVSTGNASEFECKFCNREFASRSGVRQHIRLLHPEEDAPFNDHLCTNCGETFDSYSGVQLHRKRTHPVEFNAELEAKLPLEKKTWGQLETSNMAELEARYTGRWHNQFLAEKLPHRSVEQVKSKRRNPAYRLLVEKYKRDFEEAGPDNDVSDTEPAESGTSAGVETVFCHTPDVDSSSEEVGGSESPPSNFLIPPGPPLNTPPRMTDCATISLNVPLAGSQDVQPEITDRVESDSNRILRDHIRNLIPSLKESVRHLARLAISDGNAAKTALDDFVLSLTKQNKRITRSKRPPNGISNKRELFGLTQKLWAKNKTGTANKLLDGVDLLKSGDHPPINTLHTKFSELFDAPSLADINFHMAADKISSNLSYPINNDEIVRAITKSKSQAKGPDNITAKSIRDLDKNTLNLVFNCMLLLGHIPKVLRRNRTVLIPKGVNNLTDPDNWRPITISSILLRLMNKVMGERLNTITINATQMGFQKLDGCLSNNLTLDASIKHLRKNIKPYNLVALDLRKAFDTISHNSIKRALSLKGVDNTTITYVMANYFDTTTVIQCEGDTTRPICMSRGVKQGDPMSPVIFNIIMDELLNVIDVRYGVDVGLDNRIACLAYADDLFLLAPGTYEMNMLLRTCTKFFDDRGLSLNVSKCAAISVDLVPKKKILAARTTPRFYVNGLPITQMGLDSIKYLGQRFNITGVKEPTLQSLKAQLDRIKTAALKPNQKVELLKQYLIPRWIHQLQNPNIGIQTLKQADRMCRLCLKQVLHIPKTASNAFVHTSARDGGLGLFRFRQKIPLIMLNRIDNLVKHEQTRVAFTLNPKLRARLLKMLGGQTTSAANQRLANSRELESGYSGNGIGATNNHIGCSRWLRFPPINWSGSTYIKACLLRGNLLPTAGNPSNPTMAQRCRAGCERTESLSHVLQGCPSTHGKRIERHNHAAEKLQALASKKGWKVWWEPHLRLISGVVRKPDLILAKGDRCVITDIAFNWEGPRSLRTSWQSKRAYYDNDEVKSAALQLTQATSVVVLPFILGARGTYCDLNETLVKELGIAKSEIAKVIESGIIGSIIIHSTFSKTTWSKHKGQ